MAKVFKDACEIALSKADLEAALAIWLSRHTMMNDKDFIVTSVTLHPGRKYVVRMVVEPPLEKTDVEAITQTAPQQGE